VKTERAVDSTRFQRGVWSGRRSRVPRTALRVGRAGVLGDFGAPGVASAGAFLLLSLIELLVYRTMVDG
jgi:hypothetical protein